MTEKLVSKKLAGCPHFKEAIGNALTAVLLRDDSFSIHRECSHCKSVSVFVTPLADEKGFPGTQRYELRVKAVEYLSDDKGDIIDGCIHEGPLIPDEEQLLILFIGELYLN